MIDLIICLVLLIITHELGHYAAARSVHCKVETVSLGFGKPILYAKQIGKTIYQITPWILGGFVKLEGELEFSKSPTAFTNLRYLDKLLIAGAGCYINLLTGMWALMLGYIFNCYFLFLYGCLGVSLGIGNMLPFIPALDGSYTWMFALEKVCEKEKALKVIKKINFVSMIILMILNVFCLPYFSKVEKNIHIIFTYIQSTK